MSITAAREKCWRAWFGCWGRGRGGSTAPAAGGGPVSPQRRPGKVERGRQGWVGSRGGGEADLGPGSGRERVEWGLGVEVVGGGAMGATVLALTHGNSALGFGQRRSGEEKV